MGFTQIYLYIAIFNTHTHTSSMKLQLSKALCSLIQLYADSCAIIVHIYQYLQKIGKCMTCWGRDYLHFLQCNDDPLEES